MLDRETVLHVATLARLGLSEEEVELFARQLSRILEHMQTLGQLDTSAVAPTAQILARRNVMRLDEPCPSLPREVTMANAPEREGEFFSVQAILGAEEA